MPNREPHAVGTIPRQQVVEGRTATVSLGQYFRDPDADVLTYRASSAPSAVATATVQGSVLMIRAESSGTATVTVTARDPGGLTATQRFTVDVASANRAPERVGTIPDQNITVGGMATLDLSPYFTDPDNDELSYTAMSSDIAVATATVSGAKLTVSGVAVGPTRVVVTAKDGEGLTETQIVFVRVVRANRPPQPQGTIPDATATVGQAITVNAADYFTDPDGDPLTFAASTSDMTTATIQVSGSVVTVTAAAPGPATITVTATDGRGGSAEQEFEVFVHLMRLTQSGADDWLPAWSSGGRIAFTTNRDGGREIYTMNAADGTGLTRLTNNRNVDWDQHPAWSPDGTKIAFTTDRDGGYEIYVMDAGGGGQTRLTNNGADDQHPAWSPSGRIAFTTDRDGGDDIYVMNADGTGLTRLTINSNVDWDQHPAWSPDGTRIAFTSDRDGGDDIYVMNADGTAQTRLTVNSVINWDQHPAWSPDGTRIAFTTNRDGNNEIYVMNADGTAQTRLTINAADDLYPTWSPDGTRIAFTSNRDGDYEIYVMLIR